MSCILALAQLGDNVGYTHLLELSLGKMTPRIKRDDLLRVEPARIGVDDERRMGVGVVGLVVRVKGSHSDG